MPFLALVFCRNVFSLALRATIPVSPSGSEIRGVTHKVVHVMVTNSITVMSQRARAIRRLNGSNRFEIIISNHHRVNRQRRGFTRTLSVSILTYGINFVCATYIRVQFKSA